MPLVPFADADRRILADGRMIMLAEWLTINADGMKVADVIL